MSALQAENARRRSLLGSAGRMSESVLIAEVKGLSPDPSTHYITLDKGRDDGVFVGQPVIDAAGLVGQVVETSAKLSKVLLVTDQNHAVPVLAVRTAAQLIVEGRGHRDVLSLRHAVALSRCLSACRIGAMCVSRFGCLLFLLEWLSVVCV